MELVVDPVCGMEFDQQTAAASSTYKTRVYYFCHPVCQKIFDADPTRFVEDEEAKASSATTLNSDKDENRRILKPDCEWITSARSAKR
jgi:YHS domain-containing protein